MKKRNYVFTTYQFSTAVYIKLTHSLKLGKFWQRFNWKVHCSTNPGQKLHRHFLLNNPVCTKLLSLPSVVNISQCRFWTKIFFKLASWLAYIWDWCECISIDIFLIDKNGKWKWKQNGKEIKIYPQVGGEAT